MNGKLKQNQKLQFGVVFSAVYLIVMTGLIIGNFMTFRAYQDRGILAIIPFDSLLFLNVGIVLLGISCFCVIQLYQYKIGKLFGLYSLLLGMSIALAPCNLLAEEELSLVRAVFTLSSSVLLFQVVGYLTLLRNRRLFRVLLIVLSCVAGLGMFAQILVLFRIEPLWIYLLAEESVNGCIVLSALFSVVVMTLNYPKSNSYTKKQSRILICGIGVGIFLFFAMSVIPNIYLVQNGQTEENELVEISMLPADTMFTSLPLLLFSGVSIAFIFVLLNRAFSVADRRLKARWFVIIPLYFGGINTLQFLYVNAPIWSVILINILLLAPLLMVFWRFFCCEENGEKTYEWRLMHEVEKEKQELSVYLHDDVLQSLIAFYRKVQTDESGRYDDMKQPLSDLIARIRSISHNLYPTMVEDLGLEQSLYIFVEEIQKNYPAIKISFQYLFTEGILPKIYAMAIYRISKELVTNAAKHSGGSAIGLLLDEDSEGYYIQVQDNGKGFHAGKDDTMLQSPHMGLYTVKRQVEELQGRLDMNSSQDTGTTYHIYIPRRIGN